MDDAGLRPRIIHFFPNITFLVKALQRAFDPLDKLENESILIITQSFLFHDLLLNKINS